MRATALAALLMANAAMAQPVPAESAARAASETPPVARPPVTRSAPAPAPGPGPRSSAVTPVSQRIVTIGALNKRTGEVRSFAGRPGQYFDFHGLRVTVRSCETTPPWEQKLTGAFLQIDERRVSKAGTAAAPQRIFSGWMFAESPSLNVLESPRYDIWVKSCTMRFPETGADTVVAGRGDVKPSRSSAKKSADTPVAVAN